MSTAVDSSNGFACSQCAKSFRQKENLSRHMKNHGAEPLHRCDVCSKAFTRSDTLKRHVRVHRETETPLSRDRAETSKRRKTSRSVKAPVASTELAASHVPSPRSVVSEMQDTGETNRELERDTLNHTNIGIDVPGYDHTAPDLWSQVLWPDFCMLDQNSDFPGSWDAHLAFEFPELHTSHDSNHRLDLHAHESGGISRAPSPPNEASHEDRTPFAWSPSSRRLTEPQEVTLDPHDPLLQDVDRRFQLRIATYQALKDAVVTEESNGFLRQLKNFPSHVVVGAFLSRFATCFLPQAPVLHVATLEIDRLPHYLLAIMISIGATYCNRKNTRRFSILLQDWARCKLQLSIETDNTLLRSSSTVYAAALICYSGLWCGNKRAYELAEAMRGSVVTWLRRLVSHSAHGPSMANSSTDDQETAWRYWAAEEGQKRLQWVVYTLDCQYASLMNMPPSMSLAEVQRWECPCDLEYWIASTHRQWKALLGRATAPPSREFAIVMAPIILSESPFPIFASLSNWTAFLVLLTINMEALQQLSKSHFLRHLSMMTLEDDREPGTIIADGEEHHKLFAALGRWKEYYGNYKPTNPSDQTSRFFQSASDIIYNLCRLQLQISMAELQDLLGKSGTLGVQKAKSRFIKVFTNDKMIVQQVVIETVQALTPYYEAHETAEKEGIRLDWNAGLAAAPYSSVYIFLSHAVLYAYATTAYIEQKERLHQLLGDDALVINSDSLSTMLERAFTGDEGDVTSGRTVLQHGAKVLSKFDDWACSLNLALLLHWRSKI